MKVIQHTECSFLGNFTPVKQKGKARPLDARGQYGIRRRKTHLAEETALEAADWSEYPQS